MKIHTLLAWVALTILAVSRPSMADEARPVDQIAKVTPTATPSSGALTEIGFTLGTPAVGNIVLGYWNDDSFPWLIRVSGMDWGKARGIQAEIGWAFAKTGKFKQYVAAAFASSHLEENDDNTYVLNAAGPVYGFNWYGISLEVGVVFGSYTTYHPYSSTSYDGSPVQAALQIGYTRVW